MRFRLIVPIKRSRHPPEYTARGVAIGVAWAFTPTVGIQMYMCLMTWLAFKPFKRLNFSLLVACAWTWVTNVFTLLPCYYGFYVTGQIMLGRWSDLTGWQGFVGTWRDIVLGGDGGVWESLLRYVTQVAKQEWEPLFLGSLPWAVGLAWLGYVWTLKFLHHRHEVARRRAQQRAAARHAAAQPQVAPEPR
jgi:uncharacterized protein (DUF2062 family)